MPDSKFPCELIGKIPHKVRSCFLTILFCMHFLIYMMKMVMPKELMYSMTTIGGMITSGIIFFLFLNAWKWKKCPKSRILYVLLSIVAVSFLSAGIVFSVLGYLAIGCSFIFFIIIYLFFKEEVYNNLFFHFARGASISLVFCIVICIIACPMSGEAYSAFWGNTNLFANYLATMAPCILYMIEKSQNKKIYWGYLFLFGMLFSLILFSRSRTGLLSIIVVLLLWVGYKIFTCGNRKVLLRRIGGVLGIMLIGVPITFGILSNLSYEITQITKVSITEILKKADFEETLNNTARRALKGVVDDGSFSSGRSDIWADYLNHIEWSGHEKEERVEQTGGRVYSTNAHNTYLQVAYSAGAIAGVAFLLFMCIILWRGIKRYRRCLQLGIEDTNVLFCITMVMAFFVHSGLASVYAPFTYPITLGFWYSIILLFRETR